MLLYYFRKKPEPMKHTMHIRNAAKDFKKVSLRMLSYILSSMYMHDPCGTWQGSVF